MKLTTRQIWDVITNAARALAEYCMKNDINYTVVGSSGGLDSAVTLGLAQKARQIAAAQGFKLTSIGVTMPCESTDDSVRLGTLAVEKFGAKRIHSDLTKAYETLQYGEVDTFHEVNIQVVRVLQANNGFYVTGFVNATKIASGNIKARLRMMTLYHIARMCRGMVLSTDNWSELMMGFWTLHGDVGDFGMIQNLLKGDELYDTARELGVPEEIINARPDDGLGVTDGGDETQLGAPYPVVDKVMIALIQNGFDLNGSRDQLINSLPFVEGVPADVVLDLARRCLGTSYKRIGTINLTREQLGLPAIAELKV